MRHSKEEEKPLAKVLDECRRYTASIKETDRAFLVAPKAGKIKIDGVTFRTEQDPNATACLLVKLESYGAKWSFKKQVFIVPKRGSVPGETNGKSAKPTPQISVSVEKKGE